MKRIRLIALGSVLALTVGLFSGCAPKETTGITQEQLDGVQAQLDAANAKITELEAAGKVYDAGKFLEWFEEEGTWRTLQNEKEGQPSGFITDASGAPSDQDLKDILHMASLAVTSGGKTDWYMVAVKDPAEQEAIIGTKYGTATSAGTVTVLVFGERLLRDEFRTDGASSFQPDRGYYDSGIVTGYLNVAAIAKGYGTHMFMSPALEGVNGFNEGGLGLDCAKYLEGTTYYNGNSGEEFSNENMKFICAVVIGTEDKAVETAVTEHEFPDNWIIWDK